MPIVIRPAAPQDAPQVLQLLEHIKQFHQQLRPDVFRAGGSKYSIAEVAELFCDPGKAVFVAADSDDRVLGYIICILRVKKDHPMFLDGSELYIDDLCVAPEARRQGVARQLMQAAEVYANEQHCQLLTLNVWAGNSDAEELYQALGYRTQRRILEKIL